MKNAYGTFLAALLLLSFAFRAQAQTDFRPGYIVRLGGDTLRGQVDYRGALRSTRLCRFRPAPEAAVQVFRPAELRGYGFPGQKEYRTRLTPLPDSLDQPQFPRRFFLEILVSGPASLYARRDEADATRYYLQKGSGTSEPVAELLHQRRVVESDSRSVLRETNTFRGTLSDAFGDCPAVLPAVAQTPFKQSALVSVVLRYNQCRLPAAAGPVNKVKSRLGLGVVAGAQQGRLVFSGENSQSGGSFWSKPAPMVGLAVYFTGPALNEHLMLRFEALYGSQDYQDEYPLASPAYPQATGQGSYQISYLRLPLLVRYTAPPGRRLRPVAELGLSVNALLKVESAQRFRYVTSLPYGPWQPVFTDEELRGLETGALGSLGVQLPWLPGRDLTLLGRAEWSSGFINAVGQESHFWRFYLLLGLHLTR